MTASDRASGGTVRALGRLATLHTPGTGSLETFPRSQKGQEVRWSRALPVGPESGLWPHTEGRTVVSKFSFLELSSDTSCLLSDLGSLT